MRPHVTEAIQDGAWKGRRCFVVGGGPSLTGFDFRRLAGELWIGCNVAHLERPTIAFSICYRYMRDVIRPPGPQAASWAACPSLRVFMDPPTAPGKDPIDGVPGYAVGNCGNHWGRSLATGLRQGPLSGIVAANLADCLGPDTIYLLGMDCRIDEATGKANYHDTYWWNNDGVKRPKETRYKGARDVWEKHAPEIRAKVVVLGDSALECFAKGRVEDVLP